MHIDVIGVPMFYGCDRDGAQYGPKNLRENGLIDLLKREDRNAFDKGDINIPSVPVDDKYKWDSHLKYLEPIVEINTELSKKVKESLDGKGFPFIIGGDHALGLGSIVGSSSHFNNIAVVWIDAHGDINTPETSPSGNIHGMPLGAALGRGHTSLTTLGGNDPKVLPQNTYIIGARDLDKGEIILAKEMNINLYTMEDIRKMGIKNMIDEVCFKIKESGIDGVHVSFDIDVMDSSLVPGTGTPVPDGFTIEEAKQVLTGFLDNEFADSLDFVEFNPIRDKDDTTLRSCQDVLQHIGTLI